MPARRPAHDPLDDELTPAEAAATLGVSTRTLDRLRAAGRIGYVRVGAQRRVYYTRRDVAEYVRTLRVITPADERGA